MTSKKAIFGRFTLLLIGIFILFLPSILAIIIQEGAAGESIVCAADGNNYPVSIGISGVANKTFNLARYGLDNLSISWVDFDTNDTAAVSNLQQDNATQAALIDSKVTIGSENQTKSYCGNITGAASDLCTITGATLEYGEYTPTFSLVQNMQATTLRKAFYTRVGNITQVTLQVALDPTTSGGISRVGITLPIASDLANYDLQGYGLAHAWNNTGYVLANVTAEIAEFNFQPRTNANHENTIMFTYMIK